MGRRWLGGVVAAACLAGISPGAAAARPEPHLYVVEAVEAEWTAWLEKGRFRVWSVRAARYRDLATGDVTTLARVDRMDCTVDSGGRECDSVGARSARGEPTIFEVAPDFSGAVVRIGPHHVEWESRDPLDDPLAAVPYYYSHEEQCAAGRGGGSGLFRESLASGAIFGRTLESVASDPSAFVGRYVLETECAPDADWRG